MTDTTTRPGELPSIEQFSDLGQDFVFPKGLEGETLVYFIKYLTGWSKGDKFIRLWAVFGDDFLLFLSVFQGESVKVPPVNSMQKMKTYCQIYDFIKRRGFTEEAYKLCEKTFQRKRYHLERIVARVERILRRLEKQELKVGTDG